MKTIYFVRHGESTANAGHPVIQGGKSELTDKGIEQAKFIAERCKNLSFEALIASHLIRAQKTAEYIAEATGKTIEVQEVFTERRPPSRLIGLPRHEPETRRLIEEWNESLYSSGKKVEDGENFGEITKRAADALRYLAERPENDILVVSHGFFLRTMLAIAMFGEEISAEELTKVIKTFRMSNTALSVMQYAPDTMDSGDGIMQSPWIVRVWADRAHLG